MNFSNFLYPLDYHFFMKAFELRYTIYNTYVITLIIRHTITEHELYKNI